MNNMETEQIIAEIEELLDFADVEGAVMQLMDYCSNLSDLEASKLIFEVIGRQYNNFKSDMLAAFLEVIIRRSPNLAQVNYPDNFLFKLCVTTGSMDLYDCFVEEAAERFLKGKSEEEIEDYYTDLYAVSLDLSELFFPKYDLCLKGQDYNGAFATMSDDDDVMLINREDYYKMEETIEYYNRIVGRRDIVDDLEKRSSGEE